LAWVNNPCRSCGLDSPANKASVYQGCGHCLQYSQPWSDLAVTFRYEGTLPWVFHQIKHHQALRLADQLIQIALAEVRLPITAQTLLIPMPSNSLRLAKRGFSLSLLMAQALSRRSGRPVVPLLRINRHLKPQKNLARPERFAQMVGAFSLNEPVARQWMAPRQDRSWQEQSLLLIDDVLTTGATLQSAAECLRDAGAQTLHAWLLARTPEK
jgi:ComF family protein